MSVLTEKHFHSEAAAYAFVEKKVWPDGPVCPHCGGYERIGKMGGKSTRMGAYKCYQCRKPFTVKIGTIFEDSHVKMHIWLQAIYLMASSKKGISSNQLHRTLGVTLKTAWFMSHRIREAMKAADGSGPLGGFGKVVEADETYIGNKKNIRKGRGTRHKEVVFALVERGGEVRAFHVEDSRSKNLKPILMAHADKRSTLMTDEARVYTAPGRKFRAHLSVNHSLEEYVRGDAYTNTIENYFSVFKRGMKGTYQHCGERHLHRYLAEFDFRYNNRKALGIDDAARANIALRGIMGKRLTYRTTSN